MAAYGTMKHQCLLPITMLLISALFTPIATSSSQTEWIDPHFTEDQTVHIVNYTGDIMVGAVFPIHERDSNLNCGSLQLESVQQLEALVYSLRRINENPNILPGVSLGVMAVDSCDSPHHALEQSVDFIKSFIARHNFQLTKPEFSCTDSTAPVYKFGQFDRILGMIGGQASEVSLQLANLLRLFRIPQVSYMSTSPTLSNKRLYGHFFRTVPSDTNQVDAIIAILRKFQWTYVSVVYADTDYGNNGYELLTTAAARYNICISSPQAIDVERFRLSDYDNLITTLMHKINARVVVVFAGRVIARKVMKAAKRRLGPNRLDRFVWIASDAWCCRELVVQDLESVAEGSISVTPLHYPLQGFREYFRSLTPQNNQLNPWFLEFWQEHFGCFLPTNSSSSSPSSPTNVCNESLRLSEELPQSPSLHFVRDSIYAFAITFHRIHEKLCAGRPGICPEMAERIVNGSYLIKQIQEVEFKDEGGRMFRFQENGDAPPRYMVVNFQQLPNGTYEWRPVGTYMIADHESTARLKLNMSLIRFKSQTPNFPRSFCSEPCTRGQAKLKLEGDTCCWLCTNCSQYQYLPDDFHCEDCPLGTLPIENKTGCSPLAPIHLSLTNWWTIGAILFAIAGMTGTILTWTVFFRFSHTPIIKAAGRELSNFHLTGIFLSFFVTFIIISKPTPWTCALTRFFLGFCYTVCYSAIVTKTNRIARIFRHRSCQKLKFTSPRSQLIITGLLILVEVVINIFWFFFEPPDTVLIFPNRETALLICLGSDHTTYLIGLIYPFLLICFCTVYAFKTRKCPEGFNEARYITFTNYTTCVVWFAFLPLFVMLSDTTPLRSITLSLLLSVSGTVQLFCLFVPKMYIAVLKPEKNTRETVMCGGGSHHRQLYVNAAVRRSLRLSATQTNFDHHSTSSEFDTTTTMVGKGTESNGCSGKAKATATVNSELNHSAPNILKLEVIEAEGSQQRSLSSCSHTKHKTEQLATVETKLEPLDGRERRKSSCSAISDAPPPVNQVLNPLSLSTPTLNQSDDSEHNSLVTIRDHQLGSKRDTKAVLENGHRKWPSIKLESKC